MTGGHILISIISSLHFVHTSIVFESAGLTGALLDRFYVKSDLIRRQVIGTKAVTQNLGHLRKLDYYGTLLR